MGGLAREHACSRTSHYSDAAGIAARVSLRGFEVEVVRVYTLATPDHNKQRAYDLPSLSSKAARRRIALLRARGGSPSSLLVQLEVRPTLRRAGRLAGNSKYAPGPTPLASWCRSPLPPPKRFSTRRTNELSRIEFLKFLDFF